MEKKLGFGTMRLPLTNPDDPKAIDLDQFKRMADVFIERGFCYFDTAYPYHEGLSEEAVRQCVVERYPRDRFWLADKMPVYMVTESEDYERVAERLTYYRKNRNQYIWGIALIYLYSIQICLIIWKKIFMHS